MIRDCKVARPFAAIMHAGEEVVEMTADRIGAALDAAHREHPGRRVVAIANAKPRCRTWYALLEAAPEPTARPPPNAS